MKPLNIAVIGGGRLGTIHARLVQTLPEFQLVAVVEPSPSRQDQLREELGTRVVAHHDDILSEMEAAIVAAPTCFHHEVVSSLLEQGIHVLVEKPITSTSREAQELVELAERQQLVLQVGHVERFNPAFAAALPHLHTPYYLEAVRTSGYTCRSVDIGVVMDLMIHDLDIILSLVSSPLVDIQAIGTSVFGPHEDMAQARLAFANGCIANLSASRTSDQPARYLHAYQREACTRIDFATKKAELISVSERVAQGLDVQQLSAEEQEHLRTRLFEDYLPRTELVVNDQNAILNEQRDFIHCIRTGQSPRVPGRAGQRAVEVAEQIVEQVNLFQQRLQQPTLLPISATAAKRQAG